MKYFILMLLAAATVAVAAGEYSQTIRALDLKAQPSADAANVAALAENTRVEVLQRQGAWFQVKAANDSGWLRMLAVRPESTGGKSGAGMAANLLGAAPLVDDPALQQYVNKVGLWLALQTERSDLPWHFGVLDTASINAFAAPGGYVFITRGLLSSLHSEDELAGVLAHEIAHVVKKHHLIAIQKSAKRGLMSDALGMAAAQRGKSATWGKVISAGTELYARGLDKADEFEADRMGVVIAARAGYDPFGLPVVLQLLATANAKDNSVALLFKTHPTPTARLTSLDEVMANRMDGYAGVGQQNQRFQTLLHP